MAEALFSDRLNRTDLLDRADLSTQDHVANQHSLANQDNLATQDQVADRAREILSRSRIYVIRTLDVSQEADCLVLRGNVDSFYHKQLAQELLRGELVSIEIVNHISVVYRRRDWWDEIDPQHRPARTP